MHSPSLYTSNPNQGLKALKAATAWLDLRDNRVTMRLVKEGKLQAVRIGRRIFITTVSLEKFAGVKK